MKKNRSIVVASLVLMAAALQLGCSSVTLTQVWMEPAYQHGTLNKVLVVGLAHRDATSRAFEVQLVKEFSLRGVEAFAATDRLRRGEMLSRETFNKYFGGQTIDAVFITGLVSADTLEQYIPGETYAVSTGYYGTWDGYYAARYEVYQDPGYVTSSTEYQMESNLYETTKGRLIWNAQSMAIIPEDAFAVVEDLCKALADRLAKDGLIAVPEK